MLQLQLQPHQNAEQHTGAGWILSWVQRSSVCFGCAASAWLTRELKTNTQKTLHTSERQLYLCNRAQDGLSFRLMARSVVTEEPEQVVVCQKQSTKQKRNMCSGSAGRSHCEHVMKMAVWHNPSEARSSRPAYKRVKCKQDSGSHTRVTKLLHCSHSGAVQLELVSDWVLVNREPLYLLRQS